MGETYSNIDYNSPMDSLVLTDSSQLTSDSQHLAISCQSAPKKAWGYCMCVRARARARARIFFSLSSKQTRNKRTSVHQS
ncbi:unnamed protein product [Timema podura]|uniref:Uncharacterized protein n=1 Tax=Timema podura TaxID=61482 RepID=A0ABN7PCS4_TIMPD|nr:unnamed protein product [Timema podura]